jgi:hypothetical protein
VLKFKNGNRQSLVRATVGATVGEALADLPLQVNGNVDLHV